MKSLTFFWFLLFAVLVAPEAHAYLDPASGSMLVQLIVGGIAGAAVVIKLYWHKFLGLFGVKRQDPAEAAAMDDES